MRLPFSFPLVVKQTGRRPWSGVRPLMRPAAGHVSVAAFRKKGKKKNYDSCNRRMRKEPRLEKGRKEVPKSTMADRVQRVRLRPNLKNTDRQGQKHNEDQAKSRETDAEARRHSGSERVDVTAGRQWSSVLSLRSGSDTDGFFEERKKPFVLCLHVRLVQLKGSSTSSGFLPQSSRTPPPHHHDPSCMSLVESSRLPIDAPVAPGGERNPNWVRFEN